jgi:hypothetical protein
MGILREHQGKVYCDTGSVPNFVLKWTVLASKGDAT